MKILPFTNQERHIEKIILRLFKSTYFSYQEKKISDKNENLGKPTYLQTFRIC